MWLPVGIRLKAQRVGERLIAANPDLVFGLQEKDNKHFRWVNRNLVRLDRLCNGKSAFRKRASHPLEISNTYFGNEQALQGGKEGGKNE